MTCCPFLLPRAAAGRQQTSSWLPDRRLTGSQRRNRRTQAEFLLGALRSRFFFLIAFFSFLAASFTAFFAANLFFFKSSSWSQRSASPARSHPHASEVKHLLSYTPRSAQHHTSTSAFLARFFGAIAWHWHRNSANPCTCADTRGTHARAPQRRFFNRFMEGMFEPGLEARSQTRRHQYTASCISGHGYAKRNRFGWLCRLGRRGVGEKC